MLLLLLLLLLLLDLSRLCSFNTMPRLSLIHTVYESE
jgi:hypothetical protein